MSKFKTFLNKKLKDSKTSQYKFAKKIGVTPTYVGQLVNGVKPPPDRDLQIRIVDELNMDKKEKNKFFNNVAKEKNDIPADIYKNILENQDKWDEIRKIIDKEIKK